MGIFDCNKGRGKYYKNMFLRGFILISFALLNFDLKGQIEIDSISKENLTIWSSDQYYWFEFYLSNSSKDQKFNLEAKAIKENTILKWGIENEAYDSLIVKRNFCEKERRLVRLFFKNVPGEGLADSIEIHIKSDSSEAKIYFNYTLLKEEDKQVKVFQPNFSKHLIVDLDYGSVKEVVLYSEDRQHFEHVKSRSRILDLSFLEKGTYILEINNEEYIINKL